MSRRPRTWMHILAVATFSTAAVAQTFADDRAARLQSLLDAAVGRDGVRNAVLLVDCTSCGLRFTGAAGTADPATGRKMAPADRFRTASVTKMITAALILRLVDQGRLQLDAPLGRYLPASVVADLHVTGGRSYGAEITLRQLLGHTTGLADYFFDGDADGDGTPDFIELMLANPLHQWQPLEIIRYTREHLPPRFAPGQGFHYADTNYVLLGLVVETVIGRPLHDVYRTVLLDPLGMVDTYLEWQEPGTSWPPLSHVFMGGLDITPVNTSADWGGGGLVSSTEDLRRFLAAFASGRLLTQESRDEMLRWSEASGGEYGLGVLRIEADGVTLIGHAGFYGVVMFYWPERGAFICGSLNQSEAAGPRLERLMTEVVRMLRAP